MLQERLNYNQAKLVVEAIENDGKPKSWYMKGIFIQGGVRNLNQRIYPVHEIERAVDHVNEIIRSGEDVLGECDHPDELTVNIDRVSHVIETMWMDGASGIGKLKILPTPKGNIIATLLEAGIKLGVSSRGSGNVNDRGEVSDFEIVTVDIVAKPSAPNAYPKPVYEMFNGKRGAVMEDLSKAVMQDPKAKVHFHKEVLNAIERLGLRN
jgi:hypothetical protein